MVALSPLVVWRGNPVSNDHKPDPAAIVQLIEEIQMQAALNGALYFEDTLANLNAITPADLDTGFVLDDGTASNNGVYQYQTSAWVKTADLPTGFVDALSVASDLAALDASLGNLAVLDTVDTAQLDDGAVTFAKVGDGAVANVKLADMDEATIKGRPSAVGNGQPTNLGPAQVRQIINVEDGSDVTDATNVGAAIDGAAVKTTPISADRFALLDSEASDVLKVAALSKLPISTATQAALNDKSNTTHTHDASGLQAEAVTNPKLANVPEATLKGRVDGGGTGQPSDLTVTQARALLDISNVDNTSDNLKPVSAATQTALNGKANTTHTHDASGLQAEAVTNPKLANMAEATFKGRADGGGAGQPSDLTVTQARAALQISNVDNTSDNLKPISAATQTALNGKSNTTHTHDASGLEAEAVTNPKLANMAEGTLKGRADGSGNGQPTDLTPTQVRAILGVDPASETTTTKNLATSTAQSLNVEIAQRLAADSVIRASVSDEEDARAAADAALTSSIADETAARTAGDTASLAAADEALLADRSRAEWRSAFTSEISGDVTDRAPIAGGTLVDSTAVGRALRMTGADAGGLGFSIVAPRTPTAIVADRVYRIRAHLSRAALVDPAGHTIQLILQPQDYRKVALSQITLTSISPTVGDGAQELSFTASTASGESATLIGGTRYLTAFLKIFGDAHSTDVAEIQIDDITDAISPIVEIAIIGEWDASSGTFPGGGTASSGDRYVVSDDGTTDGKAFQEGDEIRAITDNASTTVYDGNWVRLARGDVVASLNGQTGTITGAVFETGAQTLADKTLSNPAILTGLDLSGLSGAEQKALNKALGNDVAIPEMFGVDATGATDCTDDFQAFVDCGAPDLFAHPGNYRIDGSILIPAGINLRGKRRQTFIRQYGTELLVTEDATEAVNIQNMSWRMMDAGTGGTAWQSTDMTYALARWHSHKNWIFGNMDSLGYDNSLILERIIRDGDDQPSTRNRFFDWDVGNYGGFQVTIGIDNFTFLDTWQVGQTTWTIEKDWTEYFKSSIKFGYFDANYVFVELGYHKNEFDVTYNGSGHPVIAPTTPADLEGLQVLALSANADPTDHYMFSNDVMDGVKGNRGKYFGDQHVTWYDGAVQYAGRYLPANDGFRSIRANPFPESMRSHGGYDGCAIFGSNFGLNAGGLTDGETSLIRHLELGPGSHGNRSNATVDFSTQDRTGFNSMAEFIDGKAMLIPGGTITTDGTDTATCNSFDPREYFTLMGSSPDQVRILGRPFKISAIGATTLTLTENAPAVTAQPVYRFNPQLEATASLEIGGGIGERTRFTAGRILKLERGVATRGYGVATIADGETHAYVQVETARPLGEGDNIQLTARDNLAGQVPFVVPGSLGYNSFCIAVPTAVSGDKRIGWYISYDELNDGTGNQVRDPMGQNDIEWQRGAGWSKGDGHHVATTGALSLLEQDLTDGYKAGDEVRLSYTLAGWTGTVTPSLREFGSTVATATAQSANGSYSQDFTLAGDVNRITFSKAVSAEGELSAIRLELLNRAAL